MWVQFSVRIAFAESYLCNLLLFLKNKKFPFYNICFFIPLIGVEIALCVRLSGSWGGGGTSAKPHPPPNPPFRIVAVTGSCFEMVFWVRWFKNVCSSPEFTTEHSKQSSAEMLWCPYSVCRWLMVASTRVLCVIHAVWDKWCNFHMCLLSGAQSLLSFESLGRLVETECTLKTLSLNVKFVWHLMGIISMNISRGHTHPGKPLIPC